MGLKKLNRFQTFDAKKFFEGKDFMLSKVEEWQEGEDLDHLKTVGTKVTGVIFRDNTDYGKAGQGINSGESLVFKVSQPVAAFAGWKPFNTVFKATTFTKVSVYGDYRNQLSVKVPSLAAINGAGAVKKAQEVAYDQLH